MNWPDERWVKLYTRDSVTWRLWRWEARTVFMHLMRRVDRAGVIDVGAHGVSGIAAIIELPLFVVEAGIAQLIEPEPDGGDPTVVWRGPQLVILKFIEAQEAHTSNAQRQRASRERRRDFARRGIVDNAVTRRDMHDDVDSATYDDDRHTALPYALPPPAEVVTPRVDKKRRTRAARVPVEGYQETVDAFDVAYRAAHAGSAPTWNAKTGAMVKRLIKSHGAAEVRQRMNVMFTSTHAWLRPPFDIGTLVAHFDKFVPVTNGARRGASGLASGRFEPSAGLDYSKPPWET